MSRAWVIFKRIGRLLKFLLICIVITVCIFMLWRVFSTGTPKELKALSPNDKLCSLYAEQGEDMYVFDQNYDDITRTPKAYGYFAVPEAVFIPEANQAQIVFRYNNSTIRSLASDFLLESLPDRESDLFDVSLTLFIDLTPENTEDNYEKDSASVRVVRVRPTSAESDRTTLYNFYRYTFDFENAETPVDFESLLESDMLIAVHTEVYYNEAIDYGDDPYGAICIYDYRKENRPVDLKGRDKKALEG